VTPRTTFRRSLILDVGIRVIFHTVLLFSLFMLFAGHNDPGGGFIGGLVAGAAFMLRYVGGGAAEVVRSERVAPETLLGIGVTVATLTGMASFLFGGGFLESGYEELEVPLLGTVSFASVLAFDIGVYLVVVGLAIGVLRSLGREPTQGSDEEDPTEPVPPATSGEARP
jgi:multicomponent Na+:H+ antiporter subunit A